MGENVYATRLRELAEQSGTPWLAEAADEIERLEGELAAMVQAITDPENQPSQFGTYPAEH